VVLVWYQVLLKGDCRYYVGLILFHVLQNVIEELNMRDFVVCYGMTETSPVSFQVLFKKGQCHEIVYYRFLHESVSPQVSD
jgi:hypothetical protein